MNYSWNRAKASTNLRDHKIDFADAATVFEDDRALTDQDLSEDEERWVTVAMDALGRVLVVVYTWRGEDTIRLISARKATPREQRQYRKAGA